MDKIPFSVYDFFGYLGAGAVVLFAIAFAVQGVEAFDLDLTVAQVLTVTVASYVVGHVVAAFSSFLLERRVTRKVIGSPTILLFSSEKATGWRRLVGAYHKPLPEATMRRVLTRSEAAAGIDRPGEALFYHCFAVVRDREYARERLANFLNLYGFSRNVAMAALFASVTIAIAALLNEQVPTSELVLGAGVALLVSVSMYLRYLKFYRLYSVELYVTYSEVVQ